MKGDIEIQILEYSYWEHFKFAKDMALILPLGHPKRVAVDIELKKMLNRLHELKSKINANL